MDLTRYDKLRSAIRRTLSPDEAAAADRALEYAAEHTASQVRHDGSPMLDHAAEVARIGLEEIGLGRRLGRGRHSPRRSPHSQSAGR
ncbi:hypothetical protein OBE_08679, partial [human gut metagenome]